MHASCGCVDETWTEPCHSPKKKNTQTRPNSAPCLQSPSPSSSSSSFLRDLISLQAYNAHPYQTINEVGDFSTAFNQDGKSSHAKTRLTTSPALSPWSSSWRAPRQPPTRDPLARQNLQERTQSPAEICEVKWLAGDRDGA
jgi:hypothetical protein